MNTYNSITMSKTTDLVELLNKLRQDRDQLIIEYNRLAEAVKDMDRQIEKVSEELSK